MAGHGAPDLAPVDCHDLRVAVVAASWHTGVMDGLIAGAQRAFADRDALFFPLLSDFWPHGRVASAYGVFDEASGCPTRSSFVVGKDGRIAWSVHSEMGEARDLDSQATHLAQAG